MKFTKLAVIGLTTITTLMTIQSVQAEIIVTDPNYFVRPALRIGAGELIDGIQVNGDLQSMQEQGVVGYSSSTVNLSEGTVKMYAGENTSLQGLQTFGSFGERITVTNGAGTNWDLSFAVEGILDLFGGGPILDDSTPSTLLYNVGIAVYKAGEVQWNNFVNNPNFDPVLFEFNQQVDIIEEFEDFNQIDVYAEVFGSVELESDFEVFDIFAYTNVIVGANFGTGIEEYEADFLNTARFGQTFAEGVEAFSSSGEFMGLGLAPTVQTPTPVPASGGLALLALGLMGIFSRRSKIIA